jgi:endonuclease-3
MKAARLTKSAKAGIISETLDELFPKTPIPLDHRDPYTLLVAVLLSAQCTDVRVNLVTPKLFAKAGTCEKMSRLPVDQIEDIVRPCGLGPAKSKNISKLSQILVEKHDGVVPQTLEKLEALPGVGHKTAQVVVAQAFGQPAFPVDTHIHRLAYRWGLSSGKNVVQTEKDLKRLFPIENWNKLHLQIIFCGRQYCPARGHDRDECPLCSKVGRKSM